MRLLSILRPLRHHLPLPLLSALLLLVLLPRLTPADPSHWTLQSLYTTLLPLHNTLRRAHSTPPLTWSPALSSLSLTAAQTCSFSHPPGVATNLAWVTGAGARPAGLFQAWTENERVMFEEGGRKLRDGVLHYTQVVWRDTKEVGCAAVDCEGKGGSARGWFLVCAYNPGGNVVGQEGEMVGRYSGKVEEEEEVPKEMPVPKETTVSKVTTVTVPKVATPKETTANGAVPKKEVEDPEGEKAWPGGKPEWIVDLEKDITGNTGAGAGVGAENGASNGADSGSGANSGGLDADNLLKAPLEGAGAGRKMKLEWALGVVWIAMIGLVGLICLL